MSNTAVLTLDVFLLARISEDEADAQAVVADFPRWDNPDWEANCRADGGGLPAADHMARWSPARVLAECEAKRGILEEHRDWPTRGEDCGTCESQWPCATLKLLALPYADHPDCREEWRPAA